MASWPLKASHSHRPYAIVKKRKWTTKDMLNAAFQPKRKTSTTPSRTLTRACIPTLSAKSSPTSSAMTRSIATSCTPMARERNPHWPTSIGKRLCVGATDNMLLSSTIGRNKSLIPGEVISALINGTEHFLQKLRDLGIGIYLTGGETADVGDLVRTVIVDSTVTTRIKRDEVIENNIQPNDVIVAFASYGQATYEDSYNGGMGSNGLTSARHDMLNHYLAEKYDESYDHSIPEDLVYSGPHKLTDLTEVPGVDVGKLILSPTRTYAPLMIPILKEFRKQIHGIIHCSGGAQTKVLHFVDKLHIVKDNMLALPPLFRMIQAASGTDWHEMYKVFNMGHRLEIYTNEKAANEMIAIAKEFNIDSQIIGHVETSEQKKLTIKSEFGLFKY